MRIRPVVPDPTPDEPIVLVPVIRDPVTTLPLPIDGGEVPDDSIFWRRLLLYGEVELCPEPSATAHASSPIPASPEPPNPRPKE